MAVKKKMKKKVAKKKVDPRIALLETIADEISIFQENAESHMGGNKSAGGRSRKASLNLTKLFKEWRKETIAAG